MDFSLLMTVYHRETPDNFRTSLQSVLVEQSVLPKQFVLVYDGPVSEELHQVTVEFQDKFVNEFELVELPENVGQGGASKAGFERCKYALVARMDSDDIAVPTRFEKELRIFEKHPDIDVVGGHISEFDSSPDNITGIRAVPEIHDDIVKMFRRRNPVNNVTVMYRREALVDAGGYSEERANEDFNVYVRLLLAGKKFYNIPEVMVNVRVGDNMLERRGDIAIYHAWKKNQKLLYKGHITNLLQYVFNCVGCYCFVRCPKTLKHILYKYILRKS